MSDYLCCPKCHSRHIHSEEKGFGVGKALAGVWALGSVGLLAGNIGRHDIIMTCLSCGHKFKPGEADIEDVEPMSFREQLALEEEKREKVRLRKERVEKIDIRNLDPLFTKAAELVVKHQRATESFLERGLTISINKAEMIMDQLEKVGIVSADYGSKPREVLIQDVGYLNEYLKSKGNKEILRRERIEKIDIRKLDPLFTEAAELVVKGQHASISVIQRGLSIGYNKAQMIMDQLEKVGIVGADYGSSLREVLIKDVAYLNAYLNGKGIGIITDNEIVDSESNINQDKPNESAEYDGDLDELLRYLAVCLLVDKKVSVSDFQYDMSRTFHIKLNEEQAKIIFTKFEVVGAGKYNKDSNTIELLIDDKEKVMAIVSNIKKNGNN